MKFGAAFSEAANTFVSGGLSRTPEQNAADLEKIVRSIVRAVVPGRQQKKNLDPLMELAEKAATRAMRRAKP